MARNKQTANKAERKAIEAIVNSHPEKLAGVEFDAEQGLWIATFAEGVELDAMEGDDLEQLLADAVDAAAEALAAKGEETDSDEEPVVKTIVPTKYRREYAARGDARSCGDWLAIAMRNLLNGGSKKNPVDLEKTYALARANGCDKEWPHLNPGQQRMNAGNAIRRHVKEVGFLTVPASVSETGEEVKLYP